MSDSLFDFIKEAENILSNWYVQPSAGVSITISSSHKLRCSTLECPNEAIVGENGKPYCAACVIKVRRLKKIAQVETHFVGLFNLFTTAEERRKLYKALASVYHPDTGGNRDEKEAIMTILNKVKVVSGI